MIEIRPAVADDWPPIWAMLEPIFRAGETYALPADIEQGEARRYWMGPDRKVFLATEEGVALGTGFAHPNQQGGGAHVANCAFATAAAARGRGVARALCAHAIDYCREAGFRAIQFNFVVSTNEPAIHLWHSFGFDVLARLPKAFEHPRLGFVDALVMWKTL
jgi:ribosomal protein S18 acetylase RimI-like enzyme